MASVRKCKIVGIRKVEYTRRATGEQVSGQEFYLTYRDPDIQGLGCGRMFIRAGQLDKPIDPNQDVKVYHDEFRNTFAYIPD